MKTLVIIDTLIDDLSAVHLLQASCFELTTKKEIIERLDTLGNYKFVLDCTLGNFLEEDAKNVGQLVIDDGREYVLIEGIEVHKCENISLIYDKKRSLFFEESVKKLHRIQKMNFEKFLLNFTGKNYPETDYAELEIETQTQKKFKLVKTMPTEKEVGVEYLTVATAKGLNRIFDIIDSIVEVDEC